MSTENRRYQKRARARSEQATRDRIARTAAELHEELGVARTTVAEIARRAGVTRLTVYHHFPDLASLLPACSAHYEEQHPPPDFTDALAAPPGERSVMALVRLYDWYAETEPLFAKAYGDRHAVPELDAFLTDTVDRMQDELADALARPVRGRVGQRRRLLLRLAVDFGTWRRLRREGLDDASAARMMAEVAAAA